VESNSSSNDFAVADGSTCLVKCVAEDGKEDDGSDDRLEGEEVLDLGISVKRQRGQEAWLDDVRNAQERQL
jgi:hypothetical protein